MNRFADWSKAERLTLELTKYGSVLILGAGLGIFSSLYNSLLAVLGSGIFAAAAIMLYASSQSRNRTFSIVSTEAVSKNSFLFYLFYLSFFLSLTIPKSGRTISNIPITTANILILCSLFFWVLKFIFSKKSLALIPLFHSLSLFIFYGIIAVLIGLANGNPYKQIILDFTAFIGFIPVYFLVCSILQTKIQLKKVTGAVVLAMIIVCFYGILQRQLGFERVAIPGITEQYNLIQYAAFGGRWNFIPGGGKKLYSTFQNRNVFGNHLALFIPFLGGIYLGTQKTWKKIFMSGIFLLSWYILILTYSRGALVGTVSGMLILGIIAKKIRFKAIIAIILIAVLSFVFIYYDSESHEFERYDFRRIVSNPEQFSAGRFGRAQEVVKGFSELALPSMMFGLGFGSVLVSPKGWKSNHVDNLYLTLLFKLGIVGTSLLFIFLLHFASTVLKL